MPSFKLSVVIFLFCLAAVLPAAAAPQYTAQGIPPLIPDGSVQPQGINPSGEVFGHTTSADPYFPPDHIFFWSAQGGTVDIGDLPYNGQLGFDQSQAAMTAVAIDDTGQVTGEAEVGKTTLGYPQSISHAFVWTPAAGLHSGTIRDLGLLGLTGDAEANTSAVAINNRGQIIGMENPNLTDPEGFLWTPGGTDGVASNPQMKDLGQFQPSLLDDKGNIIGLLNGAVTRYDGHSFVSLGDPPGFDTTAPYNTYRMQLMRTDAAGDIYGNYSSPDFGFNPFVWVPNQPGGTIGTYIDGIHTNSTVPPPGTPTDAELPTDAQVFWSNENVFAFDPAKDSLGAVDFGGLLLDVIREGSPYFPSFNSYITARNTSGDLVGYSSYRDSSAAFVEHAGLMYDLNRHTQGLSAGAYQLLYAEGINDKGQIVVIGQATQQPAPGSSAFVLTPAGNTPPVAPTIQLIQPQPPDAGDPDQTVDVQGTSYEVGAAVTYDGKPLTATVYAETQILATIPAADLTAGTHTITVTNPNGQAGSGSYVVLPVRPVPNLVSVSPPSLPAGSPDTVITLTGAGLYPETQVGYGYELQNDTHITVLSASADHTQITARLPASAMVGGTTLAFYAYTPGERGNSAGSPAPILTVFNLVPTITGISPASVVADTTSGFILTINGSHFVPNSKVVWDGVYAATQYVSPTQVTAVIYDGFLGGLGPDLIPPGLVPIQVINPVPGGGSASTTQLFTDGPYPAPTLTSVDPVVVPVNAGGYLSLNGSHFLRHSVIHIGSQAFPLDRYVNYLSPDRTQVTLLLPASVFPAVGVYPVSVVNSSAGGGGGASAVRTLAVQGASLRISAVTYLPNLVNGLLAVQVTLADGPGANAQAVSLTQATLGTVPAVGLPAAVGTLSAGGTGTATLYFPVTSGDFQFPLNLRVSGKYTGGTFTSSRRVLHP